jgi:hypothetical protein
MHYPKSDLVEEHSSSIYKNSTMKQKEPWTLPKNRSIILCELKGNDLGRDICSIPETVTQGVHSSIIKLENLTITGVIPSAFKGELESPHPPLSKQKRIKFYKR